MSQEEQDKQSRRGFLKLVGGAGALWFGGRFAMVQDFRGDFSQPAYDYWRQTQKGALNDLEYMVMCGILAANPHNTQAWRFQLGQNQIDVFADRERNLGAADPERRMMRIGVGCAIENITIAAAKLGYTAQVTLDADSRFEDDGHCATITLAKGGADAALFDAVFKRQTSRSLYINDQPVPQAYKTAMEEAASERGVKMVWGDSRADLERVGFINRQAVIDWVGNHQRHVAGMYWFRLSREEWYEKRDGLSMFTGAPNLMGKFFVNRFGTPVQRYSQLWKDTEIDMTLAQGYHTPLWGLIYAEDEDSNTLVNAGRTLERAYLEAADRDLRLTPVCYATELPKHAPRLAKNLGLPATAKPLSLFRVGYGPLLERSIRRDLADVMIT